MISKSMHFGRMLPGGGPLSRIRRKRDACGAILASQGPGADATREGDAGGGARWARWGRCAQGWARAAGRIRGRGARGIVGLVGRAAARGGDGGAAWRAPWERATVGRGPVSAGPGAGGGGKQRWGAALAAHGCRMRAMAHFWLQWDGCCEGGCAGEGEMKKRPHMRPLYVKAISFERLYGKLERELRLSSSRRAPRSSSWGERIRGKLQEPWCQQRCGRSYGIPKP